MFCFSFFREHIYKSKKKQKHWLEKKKKKQKKGCWEACAKSSSSSILLLLLLSYRMDLWTVHAHSITHIYWPLSRVTFGTLKSHTIKHLTDNTNNLCIHPLIYVFFSSLFTFALSSSLCILLEKCIEQKKCETNCIQWCWAECYC